MNFGIFADYNEDKSYITQKMQSTLFANKSISLYKNYGIFLKLYFLLSQYIRFIHLYKFQIIFIIIYKLQTDITYYFILKVLKFPRTSATFHRHLKKL